MEKPDKIYEHHMDSVRIDIPVGLEQATLSVIEQKEAAGRRFFLRISSAAAVILIVITTILLVPRKAEMDYGDKLIALVEAYSLIPASSVETDDTEKEIIYEDESIIIYIK